MKVCKNANFLFFDERGGFESVSDRLSRAAILDRSQTEEEGGVELIVLFLFPRCLDCSDKLRALRHAERGLLGMKGLEIRSGNPPEGLTWAHLRSSLCHKTAGV